MEHFKKARFSVNFTNTSILSAPGIQSRASWNTLCISVISYIVVRRFRVRMLMRNAFFPFLLAAVSSETGLASQGCSLSLVKVTTAAHAYERKIYEIQELDIIQVVE